MIAASRILDTNVVSYLMRGGDMAEAYRRHVRGRLLAVSFVTVGELYSGAESANWGGGRRTELEDLLDELIVVPYDHEVARVYGRVMAGGRTAGRPTSSNDAWIGACALRHGTPLVTHNARHFRGIPGLELITEWREASA